MGYFNVVQPCVVNGLHYIRPTVQPIEVDDDTAAPLVEAGSLEPYRPGVSHHPQTWPADAQPPTGGPYAMPEAVYIASTPVGKTGTVLDGVKRTVPDLTGDLIATGGEEPAESVDEPKPRPRSRRKSDPDDAA